MLKTLLLLLVPVTGLCQSKYLGSYYQCQSSYEGKVQELTLLKNDSFCYGLSGAVSLRGTYRVNRDSIILYAHIFPPGTNLTFRIKRDRLVAFSNPRRKAQWKLIKAKQQ